MLAGHCGKQTVARLLAPVITDYIREVQKKETSGEGPHRLLHELEELEGEWSQNERQSGNYRGRKRCLMGVSFTPHAAELNASEHTEVKKLRQRNWEQTSVIPARGFVRVISDSVRTVEQYGGVSIEIG